MHRKVQSIFNQLSDSSGGQFPSVHATQAEHPDGSLNHFYSSFSVTSILLNSFCYVALVFFLHLIEK